MKKSSITGWKDVFSFTLTQTLKNKTYRISLLILILLAAVSMPLMSKFTSTGSEGSGIGDIAKVYVSNQTSLTELDLSDFSKVASASKEEGMNGISFVKTEESYETLSDRIENQENTSVILTIKEENGMFFLDFTKAGKGGVTDGNLNSFSVIMTGVFEKSRMEALSIAKEQMDIINSKVEMKTSLMNTAGEEVIPEDTSISNTEYWFIYGILFIVLMVNIMASSQIATSIVSDKSSKVLEYLLTAVKPLAIMAGKILAMLIAVLLQIVSLIVVVFLSNQISSKVMGGGKNVLGDVLPKEIWGNLNAVNVIFCLVLIALGMLFYASLAGLAGATVSRIEEVSEGLTLFTLTNLVGAYVGIGAAGVLMGSGINAFVYFAFLFPLSSPFILPGAILVGKASVLMVLVAIVLEVLFIMLLLRFVAKVYETLILHNGNKIGLKELFKISKIV